MSVSIPNTNFGGHKTKTRDLTYAYCPVIFLRYCLGNLLQIPMASLESRLEDHRVKYKKYKWGVGSNWSSRKWSWKHEIMDAGSGSACG